MSPALLFFNIVVVILFSYSLVNSSTPLRSDENTSSDNIYSSSSSSVPDVLKGNCSCGGFPTPTPEAEASPLLSQSTGLMIKCDGDGENTCKALCIALATATKAKGPEILCKRLKTTDELKLSAFFKPCEKPWSYANMTADEPLCCRESKVVPCTSAPANTTTTTEVPATT